MDALTVRSEGARTVLTVTGDATIASVKRLHGELISHVSGRHFALDLAGVTAADTAFLGLIAGFMVSVRAAGGSLVINAASSAVDEVIRVTGYRFPTERTTLTQSIAAA